MRQTVGLILHTWMLIFLLMHNGISQEATKHEVRGIFLTTSNRLDWPKSTDREEQQASLRAILREMQLANLNTLFFQVRPRGDAYYRSRYEPWAEALTGTLGKDPGWDPLAFILKEAHALGIEVHAWMNIFKVRGQLPLSKPAPNSRKHPTRAHPEWTLYYDKEAWLNPGVPQARAYTLRIVMDVVERYDIDGICFDFIRYPGPDVDDGNTYRAYGNNRPLAEWRRGNINAFIKEAYSAITRVKPLVKVGAAPVGNYNGRLGEALEANTIGGAFDWYFQDAPTWLREGWLDYAAPQVYWSLAGYSLTADFEFISRSWKRFSAGRHIYVSIGAYKPEIAREIPAQISSARQSGIEGQIYFRYENVAGMKIFGDRYAAPAAVPAMPWKGPPKSHGPHE